MVDLTPGGPGSQPRVLPLSRLMLAALVILGSAGDVAAQPTSPPDRPDLGTVPEPGTVRLSFEAALDRAGRSAPRLGPRREAMASIAPLQDAADLAITQPPTIQSYGGVRYLADGRARPEVQVAYWHNIPMRGVGSARSKVAAATTRQAEADLQIAQADSRLAAALAWVDARVAREIVDHRRRSLEDAESLAALARDRVEAGADDPSLGAIARAVVGSSRAELLRALGSETEAIMGLAHAIGLSPDQRIEAVGPTELRLVGPREREVLAAADRGHPSLQRTAPDVAMAEAQADLALASNAPNLSFGPSVTREGGGDWVFLAQISVPLPVVEPGAFAAAQARRSGRVRLAEDERMRRQVERDVRLLLHHREHAAEERELLEREAVVPARDALRIARARFEAGATDVVPLLSVRRELLAAEARLLEATAEVMRAEVRLAHATGKLGGAP